ncbi:hypothetical protein [Thalassospira alkalitolerans]|uniref:DUF1127 domain-containing protein n=1 Tax=Thalassospira alkalitolerans TaxID=1293890 RepID=A0A1Y2L5I8_9PROT|nr:hypothetical protein [Thalassospira alkalitolerans]OSQ42256.1 hypothetical protein TALK_21700 [Thalassospira alkalitolerans]|tara:strand:- start:449583 stop:449837 length:255 start_codon:yes stop_codon:yes gene_type:complete
MAHHVAQHHVPHHAAPFDIAPDPTANRLPFGNLISKITHYSVEARKRKNHREVLATLNDEQLLDIGLERKFDGHRWYVTRITKM